MSESKCQNEYCKYRNDSRKNGCYWETEQDGCRYIDPCPFCGFKEVEINKTMGDSYYVYCDNCGARGSKCIESINAVSEWNSVISDARPKDRANLTSHNNGLTAASVPEIPAQLTRLSASEE